MPMPRQKSMMVFRRSPAAVIIEPLEILYSWRIIAITRDRNRGAETNDEPRSCVQGYCQSRSSLKFTRHTDITPYW